MRAKRILVCVSPDLHASGIETSLSGDDCEVVVCRTGAEAYTQMKEGLFDLAILDCDLDSSDPPRCLDVMESRAGDVKTILLSSHASAREVSLAIRRGANDYLLKPLDPDELAHAVDRALSLIDKERLEQSAHMEIKRWSRHLAIINEIGRRASSILDTKELMVMAATQVHSRFGYYHVYFGLIDDKGENWTVVGQAGSYGNLIPTGYRLSLKEGIPGKAVLTGRSILVNDVTTEADYKPLLHETRSELCIPIKSDNKSVGIIDIENIQKDVFSENDRALLETLADQIGNALKSIRLFEREKETKEHLEALFAASCDAIVTTDTKGIITSFSPGAESMYGYAAHEVVGTPVSLYYKGGRNEAERIMQILQKHERAKNIEALVITKDNKLVHTDISASLLRDKNGLIIGTLGVSKDITLRVEMENRLKELTITDSLTGLYNQRFFYSKLEEEVERAKRQRRALALMLFDLDKFKVYNDTYGHLEGDKILKEVGRLVKHSIRKNVDAGFRYGGDEFVIILPELQDDLLPGVCRRIKESIEKGLTGEIGLSAGVVRFREHYTAESFVKLADEAMYAAKRSDNNNIVFR